MIVASPNDTHHDVVMAAADRGIHVLCEKPVALDADEAAAMVDAATAAGIMTMVPFTYRWMPTNQWIKALVEDGYVGRPYHLNLRYFTGYAARATTRGASTSPGRAGACWATWASHWLHLARWWLGEVTELGAISADLLRARPPARRRARTRHGEDSAVMTLRFASGAVRHRCRCRRCAGRARRSGRPTTPRSTAATARSTPQRLGHRAGGAWVALGRPRRPAVLPVPDELWQGARRSSGPRHVPRRVPRRRHDGRAWVDAVADGRPCQPDLAEGARVQALVEAATASAASDGRQIAVDP